MPRIAIFDELATPQRVVVLTGASVALKPYEGRSDVVVNPDLTGLVTIDPATKEIASYLVPKKYWKHVAGAIVEMTQAEKDAVDAAEVSANDTLVRTGAQEWLVGFNRDALMLRAFADVLKDEINILRSQHGLAPRTLAQLKTAIQNRIDDGTVDS